MLFRSPRACARVCWPRRSHCFDRPLGRWRNGRVPLAGKPPPGVGGGAGYVFQVIQVYADGWHETLTAVRTRATPLAAAAHPARTSAGEPAPQPQVAEIFSLAQEEKQRVGSGCAMKRFSPLQDYLRLNDSRVSDCEYET